MNNDLELLIKLNGCKIKLNSINELKTLIGNIHNRYLSTNTTIDILRNWVEKVKGIHPTIDIYINDLNYFKSISESVGSRWKAHTVDTQDSKFDQWDNARLTRKIVEQKINTDLTTQTNNSYKLLNILFKRNLPAEFRQKETTIDGDYTYNLFLNNDQVKNLIDIKIQNVLGDAQRLINYLHPVSIDITIEDTIFTISIESNNIEINKVGDKKYVIANTIDDTLLIPVCDE